MNMEDYLDYRRKGEPILGYVSDRIESYTCQEVYW